jgi:cytidine deaminase
MDVSAAELAALRRAADGARALNYAPYSGFVVLAAARTVGGAIGGGSNVENVNFTLTKHAEEVAILSVFQASGESPRPGAVDVVYVAGAMPCGSCRQFALEFGTPESLWIVDLVAQELLADASLVELAASAETITMTFAEALPAAFDAAAPGVQRLGAPAPGAPAR